jgi:YggT family protein
VILEARFSGDVMTSSILFLLNIAFTLYSFAILARALLPWFRISPYHPVMEFLIQITEPLLAPLRRYIPPMRGLDFTPMVALLLLWILEQLLRTLIQTLH